jgi:hypothetical protein
MTWIKNTDNGSSINVDFIATMWPQQNGATWEVHADLPHNAWNGAIVTGLASQAAAQALILRLTHAVDPTDLV